MEALLITRQDLVKFTATNGNVDTDNFIQWIKVAQDIHLQNYLGTQLFNKLKADILNTASGFGAVTSAIIDAVGSGYSTGTAVSTVGGSGNGLLLNITAVGGIVTAITIDTAGSGYVVGDFVTISGGGGDCDVEITGIDEIQVPYSTLLNTYCKPVLIHWAMVEYLPFAAYTIANKGIYKHNSENAMNIEREELNLLIDKERQIAQHYTERLIDYLNFNNSIFPEYTSNSNGDIFPDTNNYNIGWVL